MVLSYQDETRTSAGRINQKARTRAALLRAATDLVREGRPPSMPEAAERALISVATAYRYFPTADDLWFEAAQSAIAYEPMQAKAAAAIEVAGDDPTARLEALLRSAGFRMLDQQVPFRRMAKASLEQWLNRAESPGPESESAPVRDAHRNAQIALVVEPLRGSVPAADLDRLEHALGVIVGTDAMLALTDGVGLDVARAKEAMLDAGRWLLAGALAEIAASS